MLLIPAIDIINGRCVRLLQGDYNKVSDYGGDLPAIAGKWIAAGVRRIHLVDLDGAKEGKPVNHEVICQLAKLFPDVQFEVGGGIRKKDHLDFYLGNGLAFAILGSMAVQQPDYALEIINNWPQKVLLGLDTKNDRVQISGWLEEAQCDVASTLKPFIDSELAGIIHTDISRDGTLQGSNLKASAELAKSCSFPVYASGGIGNMADVTELGKYKGTLAGAIVGKAIYEKTLELDKAIEQLQSME